MTKNVLYVYEGSNGVIWTPILLPLEHKTMSRLVADAGKILTDGKANVTIIDAEDSAADAWKEVELTPEIQKIMEGESK